MAHGFAGERFFPATLQTDDPFVADELSLPTVQIGKNPADPTSGTPASREIDTTIDFAKTITRDFGVEIADTWQHIAQKGSDKLTGRGNIDLNFKYNLLRDDPREMLVSVALGWEIGGSGARRVGVDRQNTYTPTIDFGKGFGDLPDGVALLKPFAITGTLGYAIPDRGHTTHVDGSVDLHQQSIETGLALEYSIPYLQSFVKDVGLRAPFNRLIPVVELATSTPTDHGGRETTGTVNPGLLWDGSYYQIGVEAVVPVNARSGHNVGVIAQFHLFLDDIFPTTFGKPLFGGS